jgi:hypothetical protein
MAKPLDEAPDLYTVLTQAQDRLRGRPLTRWDRFKDSARYVDWWWIGFCICMTCYALAVAVQAAVAFHKLGWFG